MNPLEHCPSFFNASGGWDTTYLMDPKGTGGINSDFGFHWFAGV